MIKRLFLKLIFGLNLFFYGRVIPSVLALSPPGIPAPTDPDPEGNKAVLVPNPEIPQGSSSKAIYTYFINTFIPVFTKAISGFIGATCIVFIIIGGIQYLTAYGEDEALQTAKRTITWACAGLALTTLAYAIVSIIGSLPLPPQPPPP